MGQEAGGRSYVRLFAGMNEVLSALAGGGRGPEALGHSFVAAAEGMNAENALLLLVEGVEPLRLRTLHVRGKLTRTQVEACEEGRSVKGVSPSVIRQAVSSGSIELVRDPRLYAAAARTSSLEGENYSVVCAPIATPMTEDVLAVLYFQRNSLADPYDESDVEWLKGYAQAVGRAFGLHLDHRRAEREMGGVAEDGEADADGLEIVGGSPQMRLLRREIREVHAPALGSERPDPILIVGERGTGKDLVARCVHARSARSRKPLVAVNCAEIGDELAAARFFGHRRGSFTGALSDEPGYFRAAQGGVLFLDEIGDLSLRAQGCLLRVLENGVVGPVGETREFPVDVAVVMATNRNLDDAIARGTLRADFYDRFRTHAIRLAPLRERPWDVFPLLEHFRLHHERRTKKPTLGFSDQAFRSLVSYAWPGNVRELARTCSLLINHAKEGMSLDGDLLARCCPEMSSSAPNPRAFLADGNVSMREALLVFRRELVRSRIELHGGDVNAARSSLGLPRSTFHRYARLLGLDVATARHDP